MGLISTPHPRGASQPGALFLSSGNVVDLHLKAIAGRYRGRLEQVDIHTTAAATAACWYQNPALGVLVSISSVGAGAVDVTALLLPTRACRCVASSGSDINARYDAGGGIGHWAMGAVDWQRWALCCSAPCQALSLAAAMRRSAHPGDGCCG